jgi:tetratricopeptide (TPR) repeat protein
MADRYAYVTTVGLFIAAVWGAADLAAGKPGRKVAAVCCLGVLIISFTAYTRAQVRHWKNYATLFSHAALVTEGNDMAYAAMGNVMNQMGRNDKALMFFSEALKYRPKNPAIHLALGSTLLGLDRPAEAVDRFAGAIGLRENYAEAYNGMGLAYLKMGDPVNAANCFRKASKFAPDVAAYYEILQTVRRNQWGQTPKKGADPSPTKMDRILLQ